MDAFGYALAFASGTMQAHLEGKPTLAIQVAAAARSAVEAVDLALAGLPGPGASIDGPFGYLPLFEDAFDLGPVLAALGQRHRIEEVSWKPFPTGCAGP
jgi:2-methylcitrate dehydratase PrpD